MYNERRKKNFLIWKRMGASFAPSTENRYLLLFRKTAPFEKALDQDFCEMNAEDMQAVFDRLCGGRSSTGGVTYYMLKEYIRYCTSMHLPGKASFDLLHEPSIEQFGSRSVGSPLGLKRSLDIAIPVKSDVDHVLRAYMWLGYMGFLEDEAITVRADEINIRRMQIDHGDNRRPIYVEALDDILSSAEMDRFSSARGYAMRADGECILRGAEGNRNIGTAMWIRPVVSSRFRTAARLNPEIEIGLHLSYKRVLLSGICYRAYELERIGESPYTLLDEAAQRDYRATSEGKGFALDTKHTENFFQSRILNAYKATISVGNLYLQHDMRRSGLFPAQRTMEKRDFLL